MATIRPFFWFDDNGEEARDFYLSIFENGKSLGGTKLTDWVSGTNKSVPIETFDFELEGLRFTGLNAGPRPAFNERLSLYIETKDQRETDYYWNALIANGGVERPCGWLTDRFGVYWQVIPEITLRLMSDPDRQKADRARQAMYRMKKIIVADLIAAHAGHI
jgi:predicted 3-demethylubiquinone-9 3-methyltransferase (glyoxalase superfamily)